MKIACISDIHGQLCGIEPCDLLLIAGDICPATNHKIYFQKEWLNTEFRKWLNDVPAKNVVGIFGNHDFIAQQFPDLIPDDLRWEFLNCSSTEIGGLKIFGSPWQLWFYDWAFNAPKNGGEEFLKRIYNKIPTNTDIIISHGPAYGYGDLVPSHLKSPNSGQHVGSVSLLNHIEKFQPKLLVTGHIHDGYSVKYCGKTIMCNASVLNDDYNLVNKPLYFKLENGEIVNEYL